MAILAMAAWGVPDDAPIAKDEPSACATTMRSSATGTSLLTCFILQYQMRSYICPAITQLQ